MNPETMDGVRRSVIAASILDADFASLGDAVRRVAAAGVDRVHLDVMDGHFVPNLTFGARMIKALRPYTDIPFDAHLMIAEPGRYMDEFLEAGPESITFHVEVSEPIEPVLQQIRSAGRRAGLALRPATPMSAIEPYADLLDIIMIMSIEPGFGGQALMPDVLREKAPGARSLLGERGRGGEVHVDGGVNRDTAALVGSAGCDVLVVGSALFRAEQGMAGEVRLVRSLADGALQRADGAPRAGRRGGDTSAG